MALSTFMMRRIIQAHGHLILEGNETKADLREALIFLRFHTWDKCHRPQLGTSIDSLLPDITALTERRSKPKNVVSVDLSDESL